jgi:hypothetical protein
LREKTGQDKKEKTSRQSGIAANGAMRKYHST